MMKPLPLKLFYTYQAVFANGIMMKFPLFNYLAMKY